MNRLRFVVHHAWMGGCLICVAFGARAQATPNEQRCQTLGREVQAEFQRSVQARVPRTDPTTFNQEGYDIRGIVSQDVTANLGKLLSLDFGSLLNGLVTNALDKVAQKATTNFNQRINGVLNTYGISSVTFKTPSIGPLLAPSVAPPPLNPSPIPDRTSRADTPLPRPPANPYLRP